MPLPDPPLPFARENPTCSNCFNHGTAHAHMIVDRLARPFCSPECGWTRRFIDEARVLRAARLAAAPRQPRVPPPRRRVHQLPRQLLPPAYGPNDNWAKDAMFEFLEGIGGMDMDMDE